MVNWIKRINKKRKKINVINKCQKLTIANFKLKFLTTIKLKKMFNNNRKKYRFVNHLGKFQMPHILLMISIHHYKIGHKKNF